MIILGLNAFHGDSAAALVRDGVLVAAAEEERFRRIKHWAGFPSQAIAWCLREAGLALADVDHVAVNQDSRANRLRKIGYLLRTPPSLALDPRPAAQPAPARGAAGALRQGISPRALARRHPQHRASPRPPVLGLSRLAVRGGRRRLGRRLRRFRQRRLGRGARHRHQDRRARLSSRTRSASSTRRSPSISAFPHYGDEYKVMGLAPYGEPSRLRRDARDRAAAEPTALRARPALFPPPPRTDLVSVGDGAPQFGDLFSPALEELLGPRRAPDEPLDRAPPRHRPLGAGDVRGGVLPSASRTLHERYRPRRPRARRRLRHELGRQRQGRAG